MSKFGRGFIQGFLGCAAVVATLFLCVFVIRNMDSLVGSPATMVLGMCVACGVAGGLLAVEHGGGT